MAERRPDSQEDLNKSNPEKDTGRESFSEVLKNGNEDQIRSAMERIGQIAGKSKEQIDKDVEKILSNRRTAAEAAAAEVAPEPEVLVGSEEIHEEQQAPETIADSVDEEVESVVETEADEPLEELDVSDLEDGEAEAQESKVETAAAVDPEKEKAKKERKRKFGRWAMRAVAVVGLASVLVGGLKASTGGDQNEAPAPSETSNSVVFEGYGEPGPANGETLEQGYNFVYDASTDLNLSPNKINAYGEYSPGAFRTPIESGGDKDAFNENMIEGWATTPIDLAATCVSYETIMAGGSMQTGLDLNRINELSDQMKESPDAWKSFYDYCSDLTTQGLEDAGITSQIEKAPASYYSLWTDAEGNIRQAVYSNTNGGTDAMVYRDASGNVLMMKLDWCGNVGFETPITGVPVETPPTEQPPIDTPETPPVDTPEEPPVDTPEEPPVDTPDEEPPEEEEPPVVLEEKNPEESTYETVKDTHLGNDGDQFEVTEDTITESFPEPDGTTITVDGIDIPISVEQATEETLNQLNREDRGPSQAEIEAQQAAEAAAEANRAAQAQAEAEQKAASGEAEQVVPEQGVNVGSVEE